MQTLGYHGKKCLKYVKIREYLIAFWLCLEVSTRGPLSAREL